MGYTIVTNKEYEKIQNCVKEICEPILENTPIENILIAEQYLDGTTNLFVSSVGYGLNVKKWDYYLSDDNLNYFDLYPIREGYWLQKHFRDQLAGQGYVEQAKLSLEDPLLEPFYYTKKFQDGVFFIAFFGKTDNRDFELWCMSNIHLIDHIIKYILGKINKFKSANNKKTFKQTFKHRQDLNEYHENIYRSEEFPDILLATAPEIKLTKRQKDVIKWYMQGKTSEETAKILNLTKSTIEGHFEIIKERLNCKSKAQIVSEIIKNSTQFKDFDIKDFFG